MRNLSIVKSIALFIESFLITINLWFVFWAIHNNTVNLATLFNFTGAIYIFFLGLDIISGGRS